MAAALPAAPAPAVITARPSYHPSRRHGWLPSSVVAVNDTNTMVRKSRVAVCISQQPRLTNKPPTCHHPSVCNLLQALRSSLSMGAAPTVVIGDSPTITLPGTAAAPGYGMETHKFWVHFRDARVEQDYRWKLQVCVFAIRAALRRRAHTPTSTPTRTKHTCAACVCTVPHTNLCVWTMQHKTMTQTISRTRVIATGTILAALLVAYGLANPHRGEVGTIIIFLAGLVLPAATLLLSLLVGDASQTRSPFVVQ